MGVGAGVEGVDNRTPGLVAGCARLFELSGVNAAGVERKGTKGAKAEGERGHLLVQSPILCLCSVFAFLCAFAINSDLHAVRFRVEPDALRMLDANLNRCREALRLVEDYARFALDDATLQGDLKAIRHDLASATTDHAAAATPWRDTPGDVGTKTHNAGERKRADLAHAVIAAGKRFGESARLIEEVLKIDAPDSAAIIEGCRYRFYEAERRIALTLRPASRFSSVRIYVLITESVCRADWRTTAEQCIEGGADCLQLREPDLPAGELLKRAKVLRDLCRDAARLFIVNDRPDVAILSKADGVHVGQADLPAAEVRKLVGPRMIVGVSTHTIEQIKQARLASADYVGVGPVFPSTTKPRDILPGLAFAREAAALNLLPTIAIAGITPANAAEVWATGVHAIAVSSAVTMAVEPGDVVWRLK